MAKRDQDEIRHALEAARKGGPLPSYTDEDEQSVVKHVEALKRHEEKGGSSANLVLNTLNRTLDGLPKQDRIVFLLALTVLGALALVGFVLLKVKGVW
jgi:hypothetical protein